MREQDHNPNQEPIEENNSELIDKPEDIFHEVERIIVFLDEELPKNIKEEEIDGESQDIFSAIRRFSREGEYILPFIVLSSGSRKILRPDNNYELHITREKRLRNAVRQDASVGANFGETGYLYSIEIIKKPIPVSATRMLTDDDVVVAIEKEDQIAEQKKSRVSVENYLKSYKLSDLLADTYYYLEKNYSE
jgi:hypothetical protein